MEGAGLACFIEGSGVLVAGGSDGAATGGQRRAARVCRVTVRRRRRREGLLGRMGRFGCGREKGKEKVRWAAALFKNFGDFPKNFRKKKREKTKDKRKIKGKGRFAK